MELAICVRNLPVRELVDVGRFAEDHGYGEVFVPDSARGAGRDGHGRLIGRDAFIGLGAMFAATTTVRATVGVAAAPLHHPTVLGSLASTLHEASAGRFSLGVGVSHPEQTAHFDVPYPEHPAAWMRTYLQRLRQLSAEEMGYGTRWPVLLAALGPRMVDVGAEDADGLILNWLTPEHAAASVAQVRAASVGRPAPLIVVYLRLMAGDALLEDARRYDALANYHRHLVAQGLTTPEQIVAGTTLPLDDLGAARARLEGYRAAGIDVACIYPAGHGAVDRAALAELAR